MEVGGKEVRTSGVRRLEEGGSIRVVRVQSRGDWLDQPYLVATQGGSLHAKRTVGHCDQGPRGPVWPFWPSIITMSTKASGEGCQNGMCESQLP